MPAGTGYGTGPAGTGYYGTRPATPGGTGYYGTAFDTCYYGTGQCTGYGDYYGDYSYDSSGGEDADIEAWVMSEVANGGTITLDEAHDFFE